MKEELRKIYLEFVTAMVKTLLKMSGGDWVTIYGDGETALKFFIVKHGEDKALVDYDIGWDGMKYGVKDNAG